MPSVLKSGCRNECIKMVGHKLSIKERKCWSLFDRTVLCLSVYNKYNPLVCDGGFQNPVPGPGLPWRRSDRNIESLFIPSSVTAIRVAQFNFTAAWQQPSFFFFIFSVPSSSETTSQAFIHSFIFFGLVPLGVADDWSQLWALGEVYTVSRRGFCS